MLNGSVLNSEVKFCNWCFVWLFFFFFGYFLMTKKKFLLWKQHCALSWSIIQNRFKFSCSVISTGVTHLQTCFMPWWWWLYIYFFKDLWFCLLFGTCALCVSEDLKKRDKIVSCYRSFSLLQSLLGGSGKPRGENSHPQSSFTFLSDFYHFIFLFFFCLSKILILILLVLWDHYFWGILMLKISG